MSYNPTRFFGPVTIGQSAASYKTFVNKSILKNLLIANTFQGTIAFTLYLVPAGQTPSASNKIFADTLIPENSTVTKDLTLVINPGESLYASANVANGISILASGVEISSSFIIDNTLAQNLTNLVETRAPISSPAFTGTVSGITKSMVGLDQVNNTSDNNKPISYAAQVQIDLKAPYSSPPSSITSNAYTFVLADLKRTVVSLSNTAVVLTIPPESQVVWEAGSILTVIQNGSGQVSFQAGTGVTLNTTADLGAKKMRYQYQSVSLYKTGTNVWVLLGDMVL